MVKIMVTFIDRTMDGRKYKCKVPDAPAVVTHDDIKNAYEAAVDANSAADAAKAVASTAAEASYIAWDKYIKLIEALNNGN